MLVDTGTVIQIFEGLTFRDYVTNCHISINFSRNRKNQFAPC